MYSWEPKGPDPPNATGPTHQQIAGLMIRDYENPLVSLNKAALRLPWIGWVHRDPLSMASYHPHNWADFVVILIFPLVNYHGKKKHGPGLKMYSLLNMGIFQPAMSVYQSVNKPLGGFFQKIEESRPDENIWEKS